MRFDLSRFKSGTDQIARTYEPAAFGDGDAPDFRVVEPVTLEADVVKDGAKVSLKGRLRGTLEVACSRCLDGCRIPVDIALDLMYLPETVSPATPEKAPPVVDIASAKAKKRKAREDADENDDDETGIEADDIGVSFYGGDAIDLGQMMREQFFLVLPMKPLCMADCQGLCPVCGVNRNRETCSCESTWVDPRFEALKNFKKT